MLAGDAALETGQRCSLTRAMLEVVLEVLEEVEVVVVLEEVLLMEMFCSSDPGAGYWGEYSSPESQHPAVLHRPTLKNPLILHRPTLKIP